MTDWPTTQITPPRGFITPNSPGQPLGSQRAGVVTGTATAAAWPAANRAIYMPFMVETPVVATQIAIFVGAAAGNVDVGILDYARRRLVSVGSTAVAGSSTLQLLNIADTTLYAGTYWLGMVCSTVTTLTVLRLAPTTLVCQAFGIQQEALGATTIPATATFANPANSFFPVIGVLVDKTV